MTSIDIRKAWEKESGHYFKNCTDRLMKDLYISEYVEHLEKLVIEQAERIEGFVEELNFKAELVKQHLQTITDLNKQIEEKDDKIIDYDKRCCDLFHSLNLEIEARKFASETATTHLNRTLELEKQLDKINAERMSQYTNPNNEEK